jgi:hypothetical protein
MERRRYPRVPVQVSAIVTTDDGVLNNVVVVDVSSHGLGIECEIQQRELITPKGSVLRDGRLLSVSVELSLPDEEGQLSKIAARCHVVFSRRVSLDQCKMGLSIIDIENNQRIRLIRFIEKMLTFK